MCLCRSKRPMRHRHRRTSSKKGQKNLEKQVCVCLLPRLFLSCHQFCLAYLLRFALVFAYFIKCVNCMNMWFCEGKLSQVCVCVCVRVSVCVHTHARTCTFSRDDCCLLCALTDSQLKELEQRLAQTERMLNSILTQLDPLTNW